MSINRERLNQYLEEIDRLQKRLDIKIEYTYFRAKLQDFMAKNESDLKGMTKADWMREIEKRFNPHYQRFVRDIFLNFNDVVDMVNEKYDDFDVDISRDFEKIRAIEAINRTQLGQFEEASIKDMSKTIRKQLMEGMDVKQLSAYLQQHTDKKIQSYANVLARTQTAGYGQELKNEKARIAEVKLFQYVRNSPLRPNSHSFCTLMHDRTCHIDDIMKMKNAQLEPVITYRGGYNCIDQWEPDPLATEKDPGEFKDVMVSNGRIIKVFV